MNIITNSTDSQKEKLESDDCMLCITGVETKMEEKQNEALVRVLCSSVGQKRLIKY